jgi:hypothetical protein
VGSASQNCSSTVLATFQQKKKETFFFYISPIAKLQKNFTSNTGWSTEEKIRKIK